MATHCTRWTRFIVPLLVKVVVKYSNALLTTWDEGRPHGSHVCLEGSIMGLTLSVSQSLLSSPITFTKLLAGTHADVCASDLHWMQVCIAALSLLVCPVTAMPQIWPLITGHTQVLFRTEEVGRTLVFCMHYIWDDKYSRIMRKISENKEGEKHVWTKSEKCCIHWLWSGCAGLQINDTQCYELYLINFPIEINVCLPEPGDLC